MKIISSEIRLRLFIADSENREIRKFNSSSRFEIKPIIKTSGTYALFTKPNKSVMPQNFFDILMLDSLDIDKICIFYEEKFGIVDSDSTQIKLSKILTFLGVID